MKVQYKFLVFTLLCILFSFGKLSAQSTSIYVSAHPDDWQLFMNPNAYNSVKGANEKVVFIHTTAGDAGDGITNNHYLAREEGSLRAIRFMSNTFTNNGAPGTNMNQTTVNVNGHQILKFTYRNIVAYFLRLPDGDYRGTGYPGTNNQSLQKLYNGSITSISAVDGSSTYSSLTDLKNTLKSIVQTESTGSVKFNIADHDASINPDDHSDHINSSLIMQDVANSIGGVTLNLYSEYDTAIRAVNVLNNDFLINAGTWGATASGISDKGYFSTWDNDHNVWLFRQYLRTVAPVNFPNASIVATDSNAAESPLDTGLYTVSLSAVNNTGSPIIVNYSVSGTAISGNDFTALSGNVSIANGQQNKTITLTPINDTEVESSETVTLTLTNGTGYIVGTPSAATVNISSEDVGPNPPSVTIVASDANAAESPLDTGSFTINLSEANTGSAITVNYSIGGTATMGSDYTSIANSVIFSTGQQTKSIVITPINDADVENSETVVLTLSAGSGYTVGAPSNAIVNITSEDVAQPPGTNIALFKPTTASSSNEKPSARAVDNIYTLTNWWGASPYPQWWRVDLGSAYDLSKLVVITYYDGTRYYRYDIQGSLDGNTWSTLVDFNTNSTPATSAGNTFNLSGQTARYLRVNMNYNSANVGVHIVEFEAYGVLNAGASRGGGENIDAFGSQNLETTQTYSLSVYPNPIKRGEPIKIDLQLPKEETAFVEVFDLFGKKLIAREYHLNKGFNGIEIPLSEFNTGMLLVRINIQGEITTKKIFIL